MVFILGFYTWIKKDFTLAVMWLFIFWKWCRFPRRNAHKTLYKRLQFVQLGFIFHIVSLIMLIIFIILIWSLNYYLLNLAPNTIDIVIEINFVDCQRCRKTNHIYRHSLKNAFNMYKLLFKKLPNCTSFKTL